MKNIFLLIIIGLFLVSCQKNSVKDKTKFTENNKPPQKSGKASEDKNNFDVIIKLPEDRYVVVTLKSYEYEPISDEEGESGTLYKPVKVKSFDNKKKEIPEILFEGIYYGKNNDDDTIVMYGDFNFDGKMDIACMGKSLGYRDFYTYDFYLAKDSGYELNNDFSEIMDAAIATIKLDAKNKKIYAVRDAEWDESWEYKIVNNKPDLVKHSSSSRSPGPFNSYYESFDNVEINETKVSYYEDLIALSFKSEDKRKNILLFADDNLGFKLYYAEMKNDSLVNYYYSDNFTYDQNNKILLFEDSQVKYKIYDNGSDFGLERTEKGKKSKFSGDISSKKGSLNRIIELNNEQNFENVNIKK